MTDKDKMDDCTAAYWTVVKEYPDVAGVAAAGAALWGLVDDIKSHQARNPEAMQTVQDVVGYIRTCAATMTANAHHALMVHLSGGKSASDVVH